MRILLDTHIFLWFITADRRITPAVRKLIEDSDAAYLSVVSLWEAAVKYDLGKLPLPERPYPWLTVQREQHGIESLPLVEPVIAHLPLLPAHHRDPFDRLLVCQALHHDLTLVTVDAALRQYSVRLLPAR